MKQIHYTSDVCGVQSSSTARHLKRRIACTTPGLSRLKSCRRSPLVHRGARRQSTCTRNLRLVVVTAKMNMQVMVKLSVAASSGKLDLSDCNLTEVPPEVCNIKGLEVSISCCESCVCSCAICSVDCFAPMVSIFSCCFQLQHSSPKF